MGLDVLLQILRALEGLSAELALVRLERDVNSDVRGNVVTLDGGCAARVPLAGKAQVVCALAANMAIANVLLKGNKSDYSRTSEDKWGSSYIENLGAGEFLVALVPAACEVVFGHVSEGSGAGAGAGRRRGGRTGVAAVAAHPRGNLGDVGEL